MKKVLLLGATGSIGISTLDVLRLHQDRFRLVGIAANSRWQEVYQIGKEFSVNYIAMNDLQAAQRLQKEAPEWQIFTGEDSASQLIDEVECDLIVNALPGTAGLLPTIHALEHRCPIALANKETLVAAGEIVMEWAHRCHIPILPIDSEHSAIMQCLGNSPQQEIQQLVITASGGPFRQWKSEEIFAAGREQALAHPTWNMGSKITVDSASMANKGLEVIEAHWLFDMPYEKINVLVHPESIVHSMVHFVDGAFLAQLSSPDMRLPIQFALSYPERWPSPTNQTSFPEIHRLHFYEPDMQRFPNLKLAYEAGKSGKFATAIYNAADEVAVAAFLQGRIRFGHISLCIEKALNELNFQLPFTLENILYVNRQTQKKVESYIDKFIE